MQPQDPQGNPANPTPSGPVNIPPYQQPYQPQQNAYQPGPQQYPPELVPPTDTPQPNYAQPQPQVQSYEQLAAQAAEATVPAYQQPQQHPSYAEAAPSQQPAVPGGASLTPDAVKSAETDNSKGFRKNKKQFRNPLETMRPGERMICDIKRHPIGMIGTYAGAGILLALLAVIGYAVGPSIASDYTKNQVYGITTMMLLVASMLVGLFVLVAHIVYWGNHWIVTDDSVTQVQQNSLFDKRSSQLSMANLEDITVVQDGILPHLFDYGELVAETAGERSKFHFAFCPNPNKVAQQILEARETFEQENYRLQQPGDWRQRAYNAPQQPHQ